MNADQFNEHVLSLYDEYEVDSPDFPTKLLDFVGALLCCACAKAEQGSGEEKRLFLDGARFILKTFEEENSIRSH